MKAIICIETELASPFDVFCEIDKDFATISKEEMEFRKRLWAEQEQKTKE
nr:MAG TPA: hypothetical protein [Caudoviricetes sp.]